VKGTRARTPYPRTRSPRTPYQGVIQIVRFNWRSYAAAAFVLSIGVLASNLSPYPIRFVVIACAFPPLFWMVSSLIVSHYVYDRSQLYELNWAGQSSTRAPHHWINIHSGFDETSELLAEKFPDAVSAAVNIYDPKIITEPSIRIARRLKPSPIPATVARYDALPFASGSIDAAFLIFSAHELRRHNQRVAFLREVSRVLTPGGNIFLVEHTRDSWNFLAFGPGVFHFFSDRTWRRAVLDAALIVHTRCSVTPFVHIYTLRRAA
jgi:SAM-dependent methyltransferase